MRCKEFVDFLMSYLERDLPDEVRREFERHLADCPPCHVYLDTYRRTVELGRTVCREGDAPVPEEVPDELVEAILAARRTSEEGS